MNKVMKAVDIELTKEECQILYKAEQLLKEMFNEVSNLPSELSSDDELLLSACLDHFSDLTRRYSVHATLGVDPVNAI